MPARLRQTLLLAFVACQAGFGCQAREIRPPSAPPPANDYLSLTGARGQMDDRPRDGGLGQRPAEPGVGETRVARIRATVNKEAILEEEVVASALQQLVAVGSEKEKNEVLEAKLQEIIEREVILQDAADRIGGRNNGKVMADLNRFAEKEFERQWMHRMMRANKMDDEERFKLFMREAGMPVDTIKRQWVRNFIAMEYVRSRIEPTLNKVGHLDVVEYYDKHPKEFQVEDGLTWQDLFVAKSKHASPEAAKQFAEALLARIKQGEDFARLAKQYDDGDSSLRERAEGIGHKRGEIKPAEAEAVLWGMKPGQAALVELDYGYHVIKLTERQYAGSKPFDDKVQKEIKDKIKNQIFATEMKRMVNDLKRKAVIEIAK